MELMLVACLVLFKYEFFIKNVVLLYKNTEFPNIQPKYWHSITTRLWVGRPGYYYRERSLRHRMQPSCGSHPDSYSMGSRVFPRS